MENNYRHINFQTLKSRSNSKERKENTKKSLYSKIYSKKIIRNNNNSILGNSTIQTSFSILNKNQNQTFLNRQYENSILTTNNNTVYNRNYYNSFLTLQSFFNPIEENNEFVNLIKEFKNLIDNEDFSKFLLNENIEKEKKENLISYISNINNKTSQLQNEIQKEKQDIENEKNLNNLNNSNFDDSIYSLSEQRIKIYNKIFSTIFNALKELKTTETQKKIIIPKMHSSSFSSKTLSINSSRSSSSDENIMLRKSINTDSNKNILNINLDLNNNNDNDNDIDYNIYRAKNELTIDENEIGINRINKYSFIIDKKDNEKKYKTPIKKNVFTIEKKSNNNYLKQKSIDSDDFDFNLSDIDENDNKNNIGDKNISLHQTPNRMSKNIISYYKFQNDNDIVFKK